MGSFSIWHWLIVLAIVMLIFGTKRLRNVGTDLGGAVRGFKEGMKHDSSDEPVDGGATRQITNVAAVEGGSAKKSKTTSAR